MRLRRRRSHGLRRTHLDQGVVAAPTRDPHPARPVAIVREAVMVECDVNEVDRRVGDVWVREEPVKPEHTHSDTKQHREHYEAFPDNAPDLADATPSLARRPRAMSSATGDRHSEQVDRRLGPGIRRGAIGA